MEVETVFFSGFESIGVVDEYRVELALEGKFLGIEYDLVDREVAVQIELDTVVVCQHSKTDGHLAANRLGLGRHADVEVVIGEIIVGAIASVLAT